MMWGDRVIGWANVAVTGGIVTPVLGYVAGRAPRDRAFARELDAVLDRFTRLLKL